MGRCSMGRALDFYNRLVEDPDIVVPLYKPGHRTQMDPHTQPSPRSITRCFAEPYR